MPAADHRPASAVALSSLAVFLDRFDDGARRRGRAYFAGHRVAVVDAVENQVRAVVRGSWDYDVVLTWIDGRWFSECACPLGGDCKHAYAAGRAWLRKCEQALPPRASPAVLPARDGSSPAKPLWQRHEQPLVDAFTAAAGQPPAREQLAWLRNLARLHASLRHTSYGWLDRSSLINLAPAPARARLYSLPPDPFRDLWSHPPATPLALWPFVALLFEEAGVPLPAFTAPFTDLASARASRAAVRRNRELAFWRQRFADLEALATPPAAPDQRASIRLRLDPRKNRRSAWEISPTGPAGPFRPLPATRLQELLVDPATTTALDDASLAILNQFHAHQVFRPRAALKLDDPDDAELLARLLSHPLVRARVVGTDGSPLAESDRALTWRFDDHPSDREQTIARLAFADGTPPPTPLIHLPGRPSLYLHDNILYRGLPPPDPSAASATTAASDTSGAFAAVIPRHALALPEASRFARRAGLPLPGDAVDRLREEPLRPRLRATLIRRFPAAPAHDEVLLVELHALAPDGAPRARWQPDGWRKDAPGLTLPPDAAFLLHDFAPLAPATAHLDCLTGLAWNAYFPGGRFACEITSTTFAANFSTWLAAVPPGVLVELGPELAAFAAPPTRGHFALEIEESGIDWFDVRVQLRADDTSLTAEEIALLHGARGRFVRLAGRGWRRLELAPDAPAHAAFAHLGLDPAALAATPAGEAPRLHALQLADPALGDALPEKLAAQIRTRAAALQSIPSPPLPAALRATLRPYQIDGFHFLAHLAARDFGGILADDMGLGKTLQTLAWLLWLADCRSQVAQASCLQSAEQARTPALPVRALVVCPKSVVFNWENETARFAPTLTVGRLAPRAENPLPAAAHLVVVNYAQLRLHADALAAETWDAVILDEGQNIKNPSSATAAAARALRATHRLVLTGTPIENRLLDLWSLFAFAQPGLLGGQTAFKRLYDDRENPAAAHARLAARVRHFLLRRTKSQVAADLPPRTEEDIVVELDGPQRKLYDAELKRTRQLLLGVKNQRDFDTQRFNILQALLRLRQICCDPRLLGADLPAENATAGPRRPRAKTAPVAQASRPLSSDRPPAASAKLDALLDTLTPLLAEGHRVLVFSQFVTMLDLIHAELAARDIAHLMLTGQTENRQELVEKFQSADGPPVFLLSLKAAGSGLNLTAASYVVLYDPWWNPAVEAQAIDRTHRIGQTAHVNAYRLLARDTVEEKIRALQKEKSALAAAVVQEESLARVLDLESLRRLLA